MARHKNYKYKQIKHYLKDSGPLAHDSPAAYLTNMCHVICDVVAPPGSGSYQERKDKGHCRHNRIVCLHYFEFYKRVSNQFQ